MRVPRLRTLAILLATGVGLGGCAYSPFGYGSGVSVGYGNNGYYDPYYGGYSPYGSRYAPYGWYDGYYYPGAGYYVYDRYRNPYYWNDDQRRYWVVRQPANPSVREVWTDFARRNATRSTTSGVEGTTTTRTIERVPATRVERVRTSRVERREEARSERAATRTSRASRRVRTQED